MARSLNDSATTARKVVLGFLVFCIVVMMWSFISGFISTPAPVVRDNVVRFYMEVDRALGDIAPPEIPSISYNTDSNYSFRGFFNAFPDVAYVYSVNEPAPGFFRLERGQEVASLLGFDPALYQTTDNTNYTWKSADNSKELKFDSINKFWELSTVYSLNQAAIARKTLLTTEAYSAQVSSALSRLGFTDPFLRAGETISRYVRLGIDDIFLDVATQEEAEYAFVDAFKKIRLADLKPNNLLPAVEDRSIIPNPFDGKVYSSDPRYGQASFIVSNNLGNYGNDIFSLRYNEFEYNENNKGSYLILTPQEAWNNIQLGRGSLVSIRAQGQNYYGAKPNEISVRSFDIDAEQTELAYYEPSEWEGVIYPIYVFKGTAQLEDGRQASFIFYIDAIKRA